MVGQVLPSVGAGGEGPAQPTARAALAFAFNSIGIPLAATGLVYPVWAMAAMAASVTSLFVNSLGGRPRLLFEAIGDVGRGPDR